MFNPLWFAFRLCSCSVTDMWSFILSMAIITGQEYQSLVEISLITTHPVTCILLEQGMVKKELSFFTLLRSVFSKCKMRLKI